MKDRIVALPAGRSRPLAVQCALLIVTLACAGRAAAQDTESSRCGDLAHSMLGKWPDSSTRIVVAVLRPQGPFTPPTQPGAPPSSGPVLLPEHCEVVGVQHERLGAGGQHYSINFHLRLPTRWNGRFFFQGGGGFDGVVGDALGSTASTAPPAIVQGFAVVSQDSGHDSSTNADPARGGQAAFGFDPQARADYGHASLKVVSDAAGCLIG